jgi:hypothetical protein
MKRRIFKANLRRLLKPGLFLVVPLVLVGTAFVLLRKTSLGLVREVSCVNGEALICEELRENLLDKKLWEVRSEAVQAQAQGVDPTIKQITVSKFLSGKVTLEFMKREPLVVLVVVKDRFLLDDEGFIFFKAEPQASLSAVPLTSEAVDKPEVGVKVNAPSVLSAIKITQAFKDSGLMLQGIEDRGDYLALTLTSGISAWFPLEAELDERTYGMLVSQLKEIIDKAKLERRDFRKIDMRTSKITIE